MRKTFFQRWTFGALVLCFDKPQDLERVLVSNPARLYDFPKI
jgi:hypothetical protein